MHRNENMHESSENKLNMLLSEAIFSANSMEWGPTVDYFGEEFIFHSFSNPNFDPVFHDEANLAALFPEDECIMDKNNMRDTLIQVPDTIREYCDVDQKLNKKIFA